MAFSITHTFVSSKPDGPDDTVVRPSDWNAEHAITGVLAIVGLPVHANNAAAITGGLAAGDLYRTGADPDMVCVVH